jgi:hypothetical protein
MSYKIFTTYEAALKHILDKKEEKGIVARTCDLTVINICDDQGLIIKECKTQSLDRFEKKIISHFLNDDNTLDIIINSRIFFYTNEATNIVRSSLNKDEYLRRLRTHYGFKKQRADTIYEFCQEIIKNSRYLKQERKKYIDAIEEIKKNNNSKGEVVKTSPFCHLRRGRSRSYINNY